jgi:hypothetical protein
MRFGRVEGLVEIVETEGERHLRLTVFLETAAGVMKVRDEVVPMLDPSGEAASLSWQADQYTQETIGVDLAREGWEVIGAGEIPDLAPGEIARSASYAVRWI